MRVTVPDTASDVPLALIGPYYAPEIGRAAMEFSCITYANSKLSLREFEAARMATAYINGCQLCQNWRSSTDIASYFGGTDKESSESVASGSEPPDEAFYLATKDWRSSDLFSSRERLAMELAERMGLDPKGLAVDEDFWSRAKADLSDRDLVDLSYCLAAWIGLGRMTHVLGLDALCGIPARQMESANA